MLNEWSFTPRSSHHSKTAAAHENPKLEISEKYTRTCLRYTLRPQKTLSILFQSNQFRKFMRDEKISMKETFFQA